MNLRQGQHLGPYEILAPIGAGGMGEVYRARDTRLDGEVAINILPEQIAGNSEALARFEREAKAVAALSHPNILAIHDFGTHEGAAYAVMELLDGQPLSVALQDGPLPPRKAVDLARQLARGVGSAHDGGVVHRDLKPDNVFLTRDGRVKILDFGLARVESEASRPADAEEPTRAHLTEPGTVMGTVNYMSPEQARGQPVGPASDIFALGSVLYEMLTGRRPFERETAPETMTAILREDAPEIARDGIPPAVVRIVVRCQEKEPDQRFQSAHDLAFALENASQSSGTGVSTAVADARPRKSGGNRVVPVVTLVAGLILGALAYALLRPPAVVAPVKIRPITFSGFDSNPSASPDGRTVAFSSKRGDAQGIWIKQLTGGGDVALTRGGDSQPRFSPDGGTILFSRTESGLSSIYRLPVVGGQPRKLVANAFEADWSPDGSQIVFIRGGLSQVVQIGIANADGSNERILASGEVGNSWRSPRWSPDGGSVAYVARAANNNIPLSIMLMDVATGESRELLPQRPGLSGLAWFGSSELLFGWSEDLLSGTASSEVRVVLQDVRSGTTRDLFWSRDMLVPQSGTQLDIVGPGVVVFGTIDRVQGLNQIEIAGDAPGSMRTLTSGNSIDRQPRIAPDGETILFSSNRTGSLDLWTVNRSTGAARQLTDDSARDWDPAYTSGGREIVWSSDRGGNLEIWMANADGSGARQVTRDGVDAENPSATPDGEWIVYMTSNPDNLGLWKIRRDGSEAAQIWSGSGFVPELSPDGRYAAFVTPGATHNVMRVVEIESGEVLPFTIDVPRPSDASAGGLGRPRWLTGGSAIAFTGAAEGQVGVLVQDFARDRDTTASRRKLAGFDPERDTETYDVSPDGSLVILSGFKPGGTVMLAEDVPFVTRGGAP